MFSRITQRAYRNFVTTQDKNYNWGVKKENRITRKNWQEKNKKNLENKNLENKNLENKNLEKININDKLNENNHSNFPVDLNTVNNWKLIINRDIFLL
tara:strand:- start:2629 stop:2922 length:294 start_codon:yes stop_codon:yes gene_type:complete